MTAPYYLRHETPQGVRYAYPLPVEAAGERSWNAEGMTRVGLVPDGPFERDGEHEVEVQVVPRVGEREFGSAPPPWLVSPEPLHAVETRWTEPGGWADYTLASVGPEDADRRALWSTLPQQPSESDLEHLGSDHDDDCVRCALLRGVYVRERLPRIPRSSRAPLDHMIEYSGMYDPDPGRPWVLDDPSLIAVYGEHMRHLFPGRMPGLRAAVVAALRAHPMLNGDKVYDHDKGRDGARVSVFYGVQWDVPVRRKRREGDRGRGPFVDRSALTVHEEHVVPYAHVGASKSDALATFAETVDAWVDRFVPNAESITACSHCRGRGHTLTERTD